jgi:hypothetical protein
MKKIFFLFTGILVVKICFSQSLFSPVMVVTPDSLSETLFPGQTSNQILTITNNGNSTLNFDISVDYLDNDYTNHALEFNGGNRYVDCGNDPSLDIVESITVEAWFYAYDWNGNRRILQKGTNDNQYTFGKEGNSFQLWISGVPNGYITCDIPSANAWHHTAGVYNYPEATLQLYIDGVKVAEKTNVTGLINSTSDPMYIGTKYPYSISGDFFNGIIDEVRIWNVARTQEEILQHMNWELTGTDPGLAGYWKFNEGSGNITYDGSANSNHGTLNNGVQWVVSSALVMPWQWLSVIPSSGSLNAGASMDVNVTFDASALSGGEYSSHIIISGNDPQNAVVNVPVALTVTFAPQITVSADTLDFGALYTGFDVSDTLQLQVTNTGSLDLLITDITASPVVFSAYPDYAGINPGETETFTVVFTPPDLGEYSGILTFTSNDPLAGEYTVALKGQFLVPPEISVDPDSLGSALYSGKTSTQSFTINNTGGSNLNFSITPGEGSQNHALEFDGIDDYINFGNSINIANSSFTTEFWAKDYAIGGNHFILFQGTSSTNYGLHVGFRSNDVFTFAFFGNDLDTPSSYADTVWHHWACTFDVSTKARKIYQDGIEVANDISWANYQGSGTLYMGTRTWFDIYFKGIIDDMRIWNVARTQEEIQQNMGHELSGNESGLIGYWNFDEGSGITVHDQSPNGNDGTLLNGVTWTDDFAPMASWLSVSPETGSIPPDSDLNVQVAFNAANLAGGDYQADIIIYSNDQDDPEVLIPVTLAVTNAPSIVAKQDSLNFGEVFITYPDTLELVIENTGSQDLFIYSAMAEPYEYSISPPYASIDPGETQTFAVAFLPQAIGDYPGMITLTSNDPLVMQKTIYLIGQGILPPVIAVSPASLEIELHPWQTQTKSFTIFNNGGSDLNFSISPGSSNNNYSLEFDGENDFVIVENPSLYYFNQFTIEAWIYLDEFKFGNGIITFGDPDSERFSLLCDQNYLQYMQDWATGAGLSISIPCLTLNNWYHAAVTHSGTLVSCYLDGNLIQTVQLSSPSNYSNNYGLYFGNQIGGVQEYLHGNLDEIRIWNYSRTAEEIQQNMACQLSGNEPGLSGYWNFNEGSGPVVYDQTPNGNNGTLLNGVSWTEETAPISPSWLSSIPREGIIPAGSTMTIDAIFNVQDLAPGDYNANIGIYNNDPVKPIVEIPVHLLVTSLVGIEDFGSGISDFGLVIYPNPFTNSTTIKYKLPEPAKVNFRIYNSYGQLIAEPINEFQQNGEQMVEWNFGNSPAGVYYYKLQVGDQLTSGKLVKTK